MWKKKKLGKEDQNNRSRYFIFGFILFFIKNPFRLYKNEIDGVRKAKHPEIFAPNFAISLTFEKRQEDIESGA